MSPLDPVTSIFMKAEDRTELTQPHEISQSVIVPSASPPYNVATVRGESGGSFSRSSLLSALKPDILAQMKHGSRLGKQLVAPVLRGRVLEAWIQRKLGKLERAYTLALTEASGGKPSPETPRPLTKSAPLRRLLFISDIMWEGRELTPELAKICAVETLNLHPTLETAVSGKPPAVVVEKAIEAYIHDNKNYEPDAIFFYARASLLSGESFHLLRKRWKCPLFGMNLDDKMEFLNYKIFAAGNDNYGHWAKQFDLNLSNVRAVVDLYTDRGLPVVYLPEGFHPKVSGPPTSTSDFKYEFSFVGSKRPEREIFFRRLRSMGVPIEPIGWGWPNSEGGKNPEATYRASQICLGIGLAAPSQTLTTLKTRDFECPGAGACYLTTYNWELTLHYDLGREILCYRNEDEMAEMFSFYRRRPEACLSIAKAAYRRCLAEHTWEHRFRKIFQQAGFNV